MDDKIHILLAITDSYATYCAVTLVSIFENNKDSHICVHIISEDLSEGNKGRLERIFQRYGQGVDWIQPDLEKFRPVLEVKGRMPSKFHISTFYRLFAAEWLPQNVDRVIYMDCDLIVINELGSLWEEEMDENISLCAVHDFIRINDYHRLRICKEKHTYFNAGVLLINLSYWRKHEVEKQCINYIYRFPERLLLLDQDTLNIILVGKIKYLHPKYNTMSFYFAKEKYLSIRTWYSDMEMIREAVKNPVIVHFAGEKPWFKGNYLPYRDEWMKYLNMTEWKGMKIEYKGGWRGMVKIFVMRNLRYYILGKISKNLCLSYPLLPYTK